MSVFWNRPTTKPSAMGTAQPPAQPQLSPTAQKAIIQKQAPSQIRAEDLLGTTVFDAKNNESAPWTT